MITRNNRKVQIPLHDPDTSQRVLIPVVLQSLFAKSPCRHDAPSMRHPTKKMNLNLVYKISNFWGQGLGQLQRKLTCFIKPVVKIPRRRHRMILCEFCQSTYQTSEIFFPFHDLRD